MALAASGARPRTARRARDLCLAPGRTIDAPVVEGGRYGRMFPDLVAATFDDDRLLALGMAGGICDGGRCDADSQVEAGQPFFGQYVAHDITADPSPLRAHGVPDSDLFEDARLALVWHYQWVILHDFLPTLVGNELTATVLQEGPRFYRLEGEPYIPVEFADAAYRYGHSQIKADYQLQHGGPRRPVFPDLAGFRPLAPD